MRRTRAYKRLLLHLRQRTWRRNLKRRRKRRRLRHQEVLAKVKFKQWASACQQ